MPNQLTGWRGNSGFWGESTTRNLSFADTWINSRVLVEVTSHGPLTDGSWNCGPSHGLSGSHSGPDRFGEVRFRQMPLALRTSQNVIWTVRSVSHSINRPK